MKRNAFLAAAFYIGSSVAPAMAFDLIGNIPGPGPSNWVDVTTVSNNVFSVGGGHVNLSQFASNADLSSAVSNFNSTIANINATIARINSSIADTQHLVWKGSALAAALTPILPTDGNQNHLNVAGAIVDGTQAMSINYARVEDKFDFIAGVSTTSGYAMGKVGVGISW